MQGGEIGFRQRRIGDDQRKCRSRDQDDAARGLAVQEFAENRDRTRVVVHHVCSLSNSGKCLAVLRPEKLERFRVSVKSGTLWIGLWLGR
jgi:hypothetical protein